MIFDPDNSYRQPKVDQQPSNDPSWRGSRDGRSYIELSVYSGDAYHKPLGWVAISWPVDDIKAIAAHLEAEVDEYHVDG